jgi:hypothetical protein
MTPTPPVLMTLLESTPVSTTNPVPTPAVPLVNATQAGLELITTGTLDGSWSIFGGIDPAKPGALTDVTNAFWPTATIPVDHTSPHTQRNIVSASPLVMGWLKAIFTPTAGSGTVSAAARIG